MPEVHARILLWGIAGSGKSTTLETIYSKLRPDLRGELIHKPTRLDPTVHYDSLTITLGEVGGVGTQIEILSVPGAPDQAMTRKQLLDEVDGIILTLDCSKERIDANFESIEELRSSLAAYGRRLDAFPVVLQYNKRDIADPFAIEDLHRHIELPQAAVFETIATTGHGVLATLTTISKHVVRARRNESSQTARPTPSVDPIPAAEVADVAAAAPIEPAPIEEPVGSSHDILEAAILAEGEDDAFEDLSEGLELEFEPGTQPDWSAASTDPPKPAAALGAELRIVSAGQAQVEADGGLRIPLVLGDASGQTRSLVLSLRLDASSDDGAD